LIHDITCPVLDIVQLVCLIVCSRTGRAGRHGYAYTFLTPSQGNYAGEIIKALELSSVPIPPELTELWETYKKEAEAVSIHCRLMANL
jgi:superfamily II DNA/RNA helicase